MRRLRLGGEVWAPTLTGSDGLLVTALEYGWAVFQPSNKEWELFIMYTSRQDGRTHTRMSLVQCDDLARTHAVIRQSANDLNGMAATLAYVLAELMAEARWTDPLEVTCG